MNKELSTVTKQSGMVFTGKIIALIFGLFLNFLAARFLGAEIYGKFMFVFNFISFFPVLVLVGLQQGLVYFIPKFDDNEEKAQRNNLITFSYFLVFSLSLIVITLIYFNSNFIAAKLLNSPQLEHLLKLMAPLILFIALGQLSQGVFRGIKKIKFYVFNQDILVPITKIIVLIIAIILGSQLYSLAIAFYCSLIFGTLYLLTTVYRLGLLSKFSLNPLKHYKELLKFSLPLLLTGFLAVISQRTDSLMIGYFLNETQVGIYDIALKIGTLSSFILVAFNTMFAPTISSLYHRNDLATLSSMYKAITKWVVGVNLITFSVILLFGQDIMHIFGKEFIAGSTALVLVGIGQIVNAGVGSAGYILIMTGNPHYEMYLNFLVVFINVTLNLLLIPLYGIEGAALASLVSVAIANIVKLLLVYRKHRLHPYNLNYIKLICSIVFSLLVTQWLKSLLTLSWYSEFILLSLLLVLLSGLIYYIFGLDTEDKMVIRSITKKINKK
ncbi:flippase [Bacillus solimangrovi]|uniref:Uncharacterized protein n=1 Tax=Bacillus solimangrovi TaxID=1305675 RepID=A0A1E5LDJ6_9BACI|nr:flippase [Bacillus solimangrovi]OEH92146.1 hypothetical protein BFG57_02415 [Bacillus solimangrovi]